MTPERGVGVMTGTAARMRAFAIDRFGESGRLQDLPVPHPDPAEVLVRIRAAGVNPLEWRVRDGGKLAEGLRFPLVLGQDAAGTVEQIGSAVTGLSVGEEVFGAFRLAGTYAQFVCAPLSSIAVARKPANIDFLQAAALPTPALAALTCIEAVAVKHGDTVLINGATGGVGSYAVQISAKRGARVIATAHGDGEAYVRKLGASETIDYRREEVGAAIKKMRPEGIDALIDVVSATASLPAHWSRPRGSSRRSASAAGTATRCSACSATPTSCWRRQPCPAPLIGQETIEIDGQPVPARPFLGVHTQPLSFIGLPVAVAPLRPGGGLPLGVQIIAAPWREADTLRVARALERAGVTNAEAAHA